LFFSTFVFCKRRLLLKIKTKTRVKTQENVPSVSSSGKVPFQEEMRITVPFLKAPGGILTDPVNFPSFEMTGTSSSSSVPRVEQRRVSGNSSGVENGRRKRKRMSNRR
jgi:hypothetical protein